MARSTSSNAQSPDAPAAPAAPEQPAQPAPQATVRQAQYASGEGWELGQAAPKDRFIELGPDGQPIGKVLDKAPAGKYATQVAVKGQPVTHAVRVALGLDK